MFYRYEGRSKDAPNAEWQGVFMLFDPSQRRKWYCLTSPKWYENNEDVESRAWFTEYGFEKYHEKMEDMLSEMEDWCDIRILTAPMLSDIVMNGKVQVIQRI